MPRETLRAQVDAGLPPRRAEAPEGSWRDGLGHRSIRTHWGRVRLRTQRLRSRPGKQAQAPPDAGLDASGRRPGALAAPLDLCARLPFEGARTALNHLTDRVKSMDYAERASRHQSPAPRQAPPRGLSPPPPPLLPTIPTRKDAPHQNQVGKRPDQREYAHTLPACDSDRTGVATRPPCSSRASPLRSLLPTSPALDSTKNRERQPTKRRGGWRW